MDMQKVAERKRFVVSPQRIDDELLGLSFEFFVSSSSDEPYRVVVSQANGPIVREFRFNAEGERTGSSTSFDGPQKRPKLRAVR